MKNLSPSDVQNFINENGTLAAVGVIKEIYENAIDKENPWGSFPAAVAAPAVHIARWTLGHDKHGKKSYPPKEVTDNRFNKIFWTYCHRQLSVEQVVTSIAMVCAETFVAMKTGNPINYAPQKASSDIDDRITSWLRG